MFVLLRATLSSAEGIHWVETIPTVLQPSPRALWRLVLSSPSQIRVAILFDQCNAKGQWKFELKRTKQNPKEVKEKVHLEDLRSSWNEGFQV